MTKYMIIVMCGYVSSNDDKTHSNILNGLKKLQHRGRESFGISLLSDNNFEIIHRMGNVETNTSYIYKSKRGSVM